MTAAIISVNNNVINDVLNALETAMTAKNELADDVRALGSILDQLSKLTPESQRWVLSTAAGRLNIAGPVQPQPSLPPPGAQQSPVLQSTGGMSAKEFLKSKAPKSDVDTVACLAYYLTNMRGTKEYTSRDLMAINTEAAGHKMNMSRAVDNATKQSGYLTGAGKGKKQITSYGEDVVGALPDYEAAKAVAKPKGRKKKSN